MFDIFLADDSSAISSSLYSTTSVEDEIEKYSWMRIGKIAFSTTSAIGLIALKASNVVAGRDWASALCSFGIGAFSQHALQISLPREYAVVEQSFIADYASPIFLSITFLYGNVSLGKLGREVVFGTIGTIFGGLCSAATHAYFTRNITEQDAFVPLVSGEIKNITTMKLLLLNSKTSRVAHAIFELIFGTSLVAVGSYYSSLQFARGFGVFLAADGMAQCTSEGTYQWALKENTAYRKQRNEDVIFTPKLPAGLRLYKGCVEKSLPIAHVLPGMLFATASLFSKGEYSPIAWSSYVLSGLCTGFVRHTERVRFTEVPKANLTELNTRFDPLSCAETVFYYGKWFFSIAIVGGLIGLGIAGLDIETKKFEKIPPIDQISLGIYGGCLYASYLVARFAKHHFKKKDGGNSFWNELYFHSHFSLGIPAWNLYVMSQMKIGNIALSKDSLLPSIVAASAWASLGMGLGFEAARRGDFKKPRILSPLSAALLGNFFVWWIAGEKP